MSQPATLDKSTTVRSIFAGLQVISPALAAQLAAKAMFRTQRSRVADWERELLESGVAGANADPRSGANTHHPGLQLCDLGERGVNRVLDGANLRCDFKGGLFNNLFAHDLLHSGCGKAAFRLFEQG